MDMRQRQNHALAVLLVLAGSQVGCGTLYNFNVADCPHDEPASVYSGVRRDLEFPGPDEVDGAARTEMVLVQVLSLPFDLVGDTVTLPFTLAGAKEWADWNERRQHAGSIPSGADPR